MMSIYFVAAAQQSKILFITFFTVPTFQMREIQTDPLLLTDLVDRSIIDQEEMKIIQIFLHSNATNSINNNKLILNASITYFGNQNILLTNFLSKYIA